MAVSLLFALSHITVFPATFELDCCIRLALELKHVEFPRVAVMKNHAVLCSEQSFMWVISKCPIKFCLLNYIQDLEDPNITSILIAYLVQTQLCDFRHR